MGLDLDILRCPACRDALEERTTELACTGCGARYPVQGGIPLLTPDPATQEEELARVRANNPQWYIEEQPSEQASPWRHHLRKRRLYVQDVLKRELTKQGLTRAPTLLDLGCGDGNNLVWLRHYADRLYGSDYNFTRLSRATVRAPGAALFLADVLRYPTRDDAFDVIFFNHVIEHIPNDAAALAEVRRILKPGGLLVLGAPNEGAWWWQWAYRRNPRSLETTDHVHFYTAAVLRTRLEKAGFVVHAIKHMGWGPPDWAWDMRLRQTKFLDDLFDWTGRLLLPGQASSLYLLAGKGDGGGIQACRTPVADDLGEERI